MLSSRARALIDIEAADLARRTKQARQLAAELDNRLHNDPAGAAALAQARAGQAHGGPVSRNQTGVQEDSSSLPSRPESSASALSDQALREAARAALVPRAGERFSALDMIPSKSWFIMRSALGPVTGLGFGYLAYAVGVGTLGLIASPITLPLLTIGVAAAVGLGIGRHGHALEWAVGEDQQEDTKHNRHEAMARARIERDLLRVRRQEGALVEAESYRRALSAWIARAEQAIIDDASDPAGNRLSELGPAPIPPDPASTSRESDLSDRVVELNILRDPTIKLEPDGRRRPNPDAVRGKGLSVLANLGPRDGVQRVPVVTDDVVEVYFHGEPAPVQIRLVPIDATILSQRSLVGRVLRAESDGSYSLEISDRAKASSVERTALKALELIRSDHTVVPDQDGVLVPGPVRGPIDSADFTAADRARLYTINRLLIALDSDLSRSSRRRVLDEYDAAVRAAGLDLPAMPDVDPDILGAATRRVALDPALLARMLVRDSLPAVTPSLWAHERQWIAASLQPSIFMPLAFFEVATRHGDPVPVLRMAISAVTPWVIGMVSGFAEYHVDHAIETRQIELEVGETIPSDPTIEREQGLLDVETKRGDALRKRAITAETRLDAERDRIKAVIAQAERAGVLDTSADVAQILDAVSKRGEPAPAALPAGTTEPAVHEVTALSSPGTEQDGLGPRPLTSPDADRAAGQIVVDEAADQADESIDTSGERPVYTIVKTKPTRLNYAAMVTSGPLAAVGVAFSIGAAFGGLTAREIFNPGAWGGRPSKDPAIYIGVMATSVINASIAAAAAFGGVGERLVGDRNPELLAAQETAQGAHGEAVVGAGRASRLAPLEEDLSRAQAELAVVQAAVAVVENAKAAARARTLADLFGAPPRGGSPDGGPNGGPQGGPNGGPHGGSNGGPNGGPSGDTNGAPEQRPGLDPTPGDANGGGPNDGGPNDLGPSAAPDEPAGDPRRDAAVAAAQRAAALVGGRLDQTHGDLLSLALPDGRTIGVHLAMSETSDAAPVVLTELNGTLAITVDRQVGTAESERQIARQVASFIATKSSAPQGTPTLTAGQLAAGATRANLTVHDYADIAEINELLIQARDAGPITQAALDRRLTRLLDQTGMRLGAAHTAERRALLPADVASALDAHDHGNRAYDAARAVRAATADPARIARAVGLDISPHPTDPALLQVQLDADRMVTVRIEAGTRGNGVVAVASGSLLAPTITVYGRASNIDIQIAVAGAIAELIARHEGAPTGPPLLRPGSISAPVTRSGLTVSDRRGLAQLRMATELAKTSPGAGEARWRQQAIAEELGLLGSGDGPTIRRGILTPSEERELAARHGAELDEVVEARQFVEDVARRAGATPVRISEHRIGISRGGRLLLEVDVLGVVPAVAGQVVARVEDQWQPPWSVDNPIVRVMLSAGADTDALKPTIERRMRQVLDDLPPSDQGPKDPTDQGPDPGPRPGPDKAPPDMSPADPALKPGAAQEGNRGPLTEGQETELAAAVRAIPKAPDQNR
ncbi:MAG: hypothetical protein WKF51_11820, partial [Geodermatophilaceae bacterium]